jgi:hypothetical protein
MFGLIYLLLFAGVDLRAEPEDSARGRSPGREGRRHQRTGWFSAAARGSDPAGESMTEARTE